MKALDDFLAVTEKTCSPKGDNQASIVWKPPPPGSFKVNVDGALFSRSKQVGVGVMVRDEKGSVIAAMSRKLDLPFGALETEAKALEIGVCFAEDVGLRDVVFEGDSQLVINAIHGIAEAEASVQNIVLGVLRKAQGFRTFDFVHVKRQGNAPAHLLAQHAQNVEKMEVWLEDCPSQIAHACAHDVLVLQRFE